MYLKFVPNGLRRAGRTWMNPISVHIKGDTYRGKEQAQTTKATTYYYTLEPGTPGISALNCIEASTFPLAFKIFQTLLLRPIKRLV